MLNTDKFIRECMSKLYSHNGCAFSAFSDKSLVYDFIKEGDITFELEFIPSEEDGLRGKFTNRLPETPISIYIEKADAYYFVEGEIRKQISYMCDTLSRLPARSACNLSLKYNGNTVYTNQFFKD